MITDDSLDLASWPNTVVDVVFEKPGDPAPRGLTLTIDFDPSTYGGDREWQRRAAQDAQSYEAIAQQFRAADAALTVQSTLDGNQQHHLTIAAFAEYADGVARYLRQLLGGATPAPPACVALHVPVEPENADDLFVLEVTVSATSSQRTTVSNIAPQGTMQFARTFEAAYSGADSYLKVLAESAVREKLDGQQLWLMRLRRQGASSGPGIAFAMSGSARYYAPAPLSHVPLSRADVPIVPFDPLGGIDWEHPHPQAFSQIDMDLWARAALAAIDDVLATDAIPRQERHELEQVKTQLAARIASTVYPVLSTSEVPGNSAALENAVKAMRQQVFLWAVNAYDVSAICQFEASVSSAYEDLPVKDVYAPRFAGALRSSVPCAFSTVSSVLAPGKAFVTSALRLERPDLQTHLPVSLRFELETVLFTGARAPLWFVIPFNHESGSSPQAAIGEVDIPIALRQVPQPAMLESQAAEPAQDEPSTLAHARQWAYMMTFDRPVAQHDTIDVSVSYNSTLLHEDVHVSAPRTVESLDLFDHLARFAAVWPAMAPEFSNASDSHIGALISDFLRLVKPLPAAWAAWVVPQIPTVEQPKGMRSGIRLRERQQDGFLVLSRTLHANDVNADFMPEPVIQLLDGGSTYTAQPSSEPDELYYVDESGQRLTYDAALRLTRRKITFGGLDVPAVQNATASIRITRNAALLRDSDGHAVPTNQPFVYAGMPVEFSEIVFARVTLREPLDVSRLSTPRLQRMAVHLERLLLSFYERTAPGASLAMRLDAAYMQKLADDFLEATVPIFAGLHVTGDRERALEMADECAARVLDWFAIHRPSGGHFRFALTLFTTLNDTREPLLELSALDLACGDVSDLPGT